MKHVGSLMLNTGNGGNNSAPVVAGARLNGNIKGCYFTPSDSRFGKIYVPRLCLPEAFQNDPFSGLKQIYIVTLAEDWSVRSRMPQAADVRCVRLCVCVSACLSVPHSLQTLTLTLPSPPFTFRSIGEFGSIATETEALLIQANCNHQPYSEDAVEPLRNILAEFGVEEGGGNGDSGSSSEASGWNIPPAEVAKRRDLRNTRIFTIDPPNAKDLDDALHITPLDDGTYVCVYIYVYIHIYIYIYICLLCPLSYAPTITNPSPRLYIYYRYLRDWRAHSGCVLLLAAEHEPG